MDRLEDRLSRLQARVARQQLLVTGPPPPMPPALRQLVLDSLELKSPLVQLYQNPPELPPGATFRIPSGSDPSSTPSDPPAPPS